MIATSATTPRLYPLLFLLVPGYVFLRAYMYGNIILDSYGRLDKFLMLALGGFISMVVVVVLYRMGIDYWLLRTITTDTIRGFTGNWRGEITLEMVANISILEASAVLILQSTIAGAIGYYSGKAQRKYGTGIEQTRIELTQPWEAVFEESNKGDKVRIITAQGREIEGLIEQMGSPSENYDLLLSDPEELIRRPPNIVKKREIEGSTYHHFRDISRIEFERELIPVRDPTPIELFRRKATKRMNSIISPINTIIRMFLRLTIFATFPIRKVSQIISKWKSQVLSSLSRTDTGTVDFDLAGENDGEDESTGEKN